MSRTSLIGCYVLAAVGLLAGCVQKEFLPPRIELPSGLQYRDFAVGTGPVVATGDTLDTRYRLWLADGTEFGDPNGDPFTFVLGGGQVIRGYDEGVRGMRAGGKRELIVPPELGYGDMGSGNIPPNAVLIFDVELVRIRKPR